MHHAAAAQHINDKFKIGFNLGFLEFSLSEHCTKDGFLHTYIEIAIKTREGQHLGVGDSHPCSRYLQKVGTSMSCFSNVTH